jgi:hypothetical protein
MLLGRDPLEKVWVFSAYKSERDFNNDNAYFTRVFNDHAELKL